VLRPDHKICAKPPYSVVSSIFEAKLRMSYGVGLDAVRHSLVAEDFYASIIVVHNRYDATLAQRIEHGSPMPKISCAATDQATSLDEYPENTIKLCSRKMPPNHSEMAIDTNSVGMRSLEKR
jgi:hypothetical protein